MAVQIKSGKTTVSNQIRSNQTHAPAININALCRAVTRATSVANKIKSSVNGLTVEAGKDSPHADQIAKIVGHVRDSISHLQLQLRHAIAATHGLDAPAWDGVPDNSKSGQST